MPNDLALHRQCATKYNPAKASSEDFLKIYPTQWNYFKWADMHTELRKIIMYTCEISIRMDTQIYSSPQVQPLFVGMSLAQDLLQLLYQ
jgi:hypothetical protein